MPLPESESSPDSGSLLSGTSPCDSSDGSSPLVVFSAVSFGVPVSVNPPKQPGER